MTLNGLYVMHLHRFDDVYGPLERQALERHLRIPAPPMEADRLTPELLAEVEVLVTSWGGPRMDAAFLAAAPRLRLVLYGAGSVRPVVTPESWARGVRITSAAAANAIPVTEFALAQILMSLKQVWRHMLHARSEGSLLRRASEAGANGSVVGLVSLGATGRGTAERLARHDVVVQAYDPFTTIDGVRSVSLEELFATSDVVSLHAPLLEQTRGMITRELIASMRPYATLVNTARGGLVDEAGLIEVLRERPDLFAVLDVTDPEPPVPGSPLYTLPNVVLTPHLAGSLGTERRRQGRLMAEELDRYVAGEPLLHEITEKRLELLA
ncbi:hydroxyacid dehydrogenase [Nonomuraea soli]|uniref:Phosphoglycerate dehydrogenase-like enzyme n=1 Tax=Nonomuraea soli TaxID=1032476 RepID=A0A7W0CEM9_9ACTN|nr:hydroxyacid dehydrogenase [Nonomuraea soli]MBA2889752.1 phosphoglycerate dehydrogenase-like enzyme [Nonomuraea soli]